MMTSRLDGFAGDGLEALSGIDVTVSVCSTYGVRACAWPDAETSYVEGFNPERVQTVFDSIGNRRALRRGCFQEFLQLAGVINVKALDLARSSHQHDLRLPLSVNIREIAGRLIGIVGEIRQPESLGSGVVSKENSVDDDRCSDRGRKVDTAVLLRHSCHRFAASLHQQFVVCVGAGSLRSLDPSASLRAGSRMRPSPHGPVWYMSYFLACGGAFLTLKNQGVRRGNLGR
jgi:hypothetical protein